MKKVWKYELGDVRTTLVMPICSEVVRVAYQRRKLCLWAVVPGNTDAVPRCNRLFHVVGTGFEEVRDDWEYIGSAAIETGVGELVFHVWEET